MRLKEKGVSFACIHVDNNLQLTFFSSVETLEKEQLDREVSMCNLINSMSYGSTAPITVMSHPPRLAVGGDYEGGLTPAPCLWGGEGGGGGICLILGIFTAHSHTCVVLI